MGYKILIVLALSQISCILLNDDKNRNNCEDCLYRGGYSKVHKTQEDSTTYHLVAMDLGERFNYLEIRQCQLCRKGSAILLSGRVVFPKRQQDNYLSAVPNIPIYLAERCITSVKQDCYKKIQLLAVSDENGMFELKFGLSEKLAIIVGQNNEEGILYQVSEFDK